MKRAKAFIVGQSGTRAPRRSPKAQRRRNGKGSSLPKRIPRKQLDLEATGGISPIDCTIVSQLRTALAGASEALLDACLERKLLPLSIINSVNMARFLSIVMLAARTAQEVTEVPTSILLADAWQSCLWEVNNGFDEGDKRNDYFKTGESFSSMEASFLDHANRLSRNPKFQAVLLAKNDPAKYLKELGACKLWDRDGRLNRVATITGDCLQVCDVLPGE